MVTGFILCGNVGGTGQAEKWPIYELVKWCCERFSSKVRESSEERWGLIDWQLSLMRHLLITLIDNLMRARIQATDSLSREIQIKCVLHFQPLFYFRLFSNANRVVHSKQKTLSYWIMTTQLCSNFALCSCCFWLASARATNLKGKAWDERSLSIRGFSSLLYRTPRAKLPPDPTPKISTNKHLDPLSVKRACLQLCCIRSSGPLLS